MLYLTTQDLVDIFPLCEVKQVRQTLEGIFKYCIIQYLHRVKIWGYLSKKLPVTLGASFFGKQQGKTGTRVMVTGYIEKK